MARRGHVAFGSLRPFCRRKRPLAKADLERCRAQKCRPCIPPRLSGCHPPTSSEWKQSALLMCLYGLILRMAISDSEERNESRSLRLGSEKREPDAIFAPYSVYRRRKGEALFPERESLATLDETPKEI